MPMHLYRVVARYEFISSGTVISTMSPLWRGTLGLIMNWKLLGAPTTLLLAATALAKSSG